MPRRGIAAAAIRQRRRVQIQDWTNEHVNFFRSIAIRKTHSVRDSFPEGCGCAFKIVSTMVMVVKTRGATLQSCAP